MDHDGFGWAAPTTATVADCQKPGQNDSLALAMRFKSLPYRSHGMLMGIGARLWLVYTESGAVVQAERAHNWQLIVTTKCCEKYPCSGRRGHTNPPLEPAYVFVQVCISLHMVLVSNVRRQCVGTIGGSTHAKATPVLGWLRHLSRAHQRSTKPARLRHIETYEVFSLKSRIFCYQPQLDTRRAPRRAVVRRGNRWETLRPSYKTCPRPIGRRVPIHKWKPLDRHYVFPYKRAVAAHIQDIAVSKQNG